MTQEEFKKLDEAVIMTFSEDPKVQDEGIYILETIYYERAIALLFIGVVYENRYYRWKRFNDAELAINKFKQVLARKEGYMHLKEHIDKLEEEMNK